MLTKKCQIGIIVMIGTLAGVCLSVAMVTPGWLRLNVLSNSGATLVTISTGLWHIVLCYQDLPCRNIYLSTIVHRNRTKLTGNLGYINYDSLLANHPELETLTVTSVMFSVAGLILSLISVLRKRNEKSLSVGIMCTYSLAGVLSTTTMFTGIALSVHMDSSKNVTAMLPYSVVLSGVGAIFAFLVTLATCLDVYRVARSLLAESQYKLLVNLSDSDANDREPSNEVL
ncbi:hypothetical protein ScPMuIL_004102 [Solemya velum]